MRILTLTPEAGVYAVAVVAVCALSCGSLAGSLVARVARPGPSLFLPLYVGLMAAVSALAVLTMELPSLTRASPVQLALSLPVGVAAGAVARWGESAVRRHAARRVARARTAARP